jgi:type III pantothenate kinase
MKLLLDIGNSRLKWAGLPAEGLQPGGSAAHDGSVASLLTGLPDLAPTALWVAQVWAPSEREALQGALQQRYGVPVHLVTVRSPQAGLRVAYADPARLGVDRWLAMLGARARAEGPVVVACAGTALTLDVVDADGQHQGGFIAPGLHTALAATLGKTRFPTGAFEETPQAGLATATERAVQEGALLACLGALDRGAALAPPQARRWLCGGDAAVLLPHLPGWAAAPQLIFEGLQTLADADAPSGARL